MLQNFLKSLIIFAVLIGIFAFSGPVYDKIAKKHCIGLNEQAIENKNNLHFYITRLDHDECNSYGIAIVAPIQ